MPNGADNLVLSGGLLPPPRRCARNEKKDKRSLVEKEIDTGACLIDAHITALTGASQYGVSCSFMKADPMAETPTTRCVECGKPTPDGVSYCGKSCRREANRQPAPPPPRRPARDRIRAWRGEL